MNLFCKGESVEFTINYKITGIDSLNKIYLGEHWGKRNDYIGKVEMLILEKSYYGLYT